MVTYSRPQMELTQEVQDRQVEVPLQVEEVLEEVVEILEGQVEEVTGGVLEGVSVKWKIN